MWKNVIKVMRSKFFKDTLKNGDYTIKKAERLKEFNLNSYNDLIKLLEECNYYGTYAISTNDNEIILPNSAGKIPTWHSGMMVANGDVTFTLTGPGGNIVSVFYNKAYNTWAVKKLPDVSIVGSNNKVTAPGLYAVTINYSGSYSTHMLSIVDLNMGTQSVPDSNGHYASYSPSLKTIITSLEAVATVYKVVCIAQYDF